MSTVFEAKINRVSSIRRIIQKDEKAAISSVDEATVWIDHIGKLEKDKEYNIFDKDYRVFTNNSVNRSWTLQRIDEGPWKISTMKHL